jgi:hypothetical protein
MSTAPAGCDTRLPSRRALVVIWLVAAVGFGALLAVANASEGPLDDPDPAHQRPGFLDEGGLPIVAPTVLPGLPSPGRVAVIFFERSSRAPSLCGALSRSSLVGKVDVVVVVVTDADLGCRQVRVVDDPHGAISLAYNMRVPRDHGPPVGYAVIDGNGQIRYRTLDPTLDLDEVQTIVDALP